jgi:Permease MlaE
MMCPGDCCTLPSLHDSRALILWPRVSRFLKCCSFPDPIDLSSTLHRMAIRILVDVPASRTRTLLEAVGRHILNFLSHFGSYVTLNWWMLRNLRAAREHPGVFLNQMVQIGNDSIPIVMFVAVFVGMVTAVQSAYQLYAWIPLTEAAGVGGDGRPYG